MKATLLDQIDQIPPCLCRLFARKLKPKSKRSRRSKDRRSKKQRGYPSVAKSINEIAAESGLSRKKTGWISRQSSWISVNVGEMMAFSNACGVDLLRPRSKLDHLKKMLAVGATRILGRGLPSHYVRRQMLRLTQPNAQASRMDN